MYLHFARQISSRQRFSKYKYIVEGKQAPRRSRLSLYFLPFFVFFPLFFLLLFVNLDVAVSFSRKMKGEKSKCVHFSSSVVSCLLLVIRGSRKRGETQIQSSATAKTGKENQKYAYHTTEKLFLKKKRQKSHIPQSLIIMGKI